MRSSVVAERKTAAPELDSRDTMEVESDTGAYLGGNDSAGGEFVADLPFESLIAVIEEHGDQRQGIEEGGQPDEAEVDAGNGERALLDVRNVVEPAEDPGRDRAPPAHCRL